MNRFVACILMLFGLNSAFALGNTKELMLLDHFRIVDLTHPLSSSVPTWNGSCGFCLELKQDYDRMFRVQQVKMHAGVGTHMDAPAHLFQGGLSIADIPVEQLIVSACVIDVSKKAGADYKISVEDVKNYEVTYGIIPQGSLVIGYTGWDRFWSDATNYRNADATGQLHFPAFSAEAVKLLLTRNISGIAIDTLSPDCLDPSFAVHKLVLGAGKYIIENIANSSQIPCKGSYVIALPLRAEESTESSIRAIALVPI